MLRAIVFAILSLATVWAGAQELPVSPAQAYLESGQFDQGVVALELRLDEHPEDDEARFGLGVIQFLQAIEKLGSTMYEYGAKLDRLPLPVPRLPLPENKNPSTISYAETRRILEVFAADLRRAEVTLAAITDPNVKLKLLLGKIAFNFTNSESQRISVTDILQRMNRGRLAFQKANPDLRIHFDRGDVPWLRAYCHLLAASAEASLAADLSQGFDQWAGNAFPKTESTGRAVDGDRKRPIIVEAIRFRRFRLHLLAVCELNRETWTWIRKEQDNDFEWLAHPKQQDQLGMPISNDQINIWLKAVAHCEELLKGQRLLQGELVQFVDKNFPQDQGLNIKKLLDDPPRDFLDEERLQHRGINAKYQEPQAGRDTFDFNMMIQLINLYNGPFGVAQAIRMN